MGFFSWIRAFFSCPVSAVASVVSIQLKLITQPKQLEPSDFIIEFIKKWETFQPKAYKPTPYDFWTIGYGNIHGVNEGDTCTIEQATEWLKKEVADCAIYIRTLVKVPLNQHQFDALVSFVYNVGVTAFSNSTLLKVLNKGEYDKVPEQMMRWVKDAGIVLNGLVKRRKEETEIFQGIFKKPEKGEKYV